MMKKETIYVIQWCFDREVGEWEDAPIKNPEDELSANRMFNLLQKKHPTWKWRIIKITREIIRDESQ